VAPVGLASALEDYTDSMGSNLNPLKRRAVFLDRDGVLNEPVIRDGRPYPPVSAVELVVPPGTRQALIALKARGFRLLVVTNQPDVRRGATLKSTVEQIHQSLRAQLPIDEFFSCFHDDRDTCACRKPLPGLVQQAAAKYNVDIPSSYLIGDRWRDIEAGFAAGCSTILIDRRYNERSPTHAPDVSVSSLAEAAQWILEREDEVF
jgi:D-glycero-D-manno-heptose 1,7-bisphosphate phosphatase